MAGRAGKGLLCEIKRGIPKASLAPFFYPGANRKIPAMKTLALLCAALLLAGGSHAQLITPDLVPPLAFAALQQHYPLATRVQWKKTQGLYQASFTQSRAVQLVRFNNDGDVEATGAPLALSALPAGVRHTLTAHYPSRKVCQAAKFVNARTEAITYETATCESNISRTLVFNADGTKMRPPSRQ
ncbi:MAG: hypothetical protein JWR44_1712 [Hymenobacter sp.]|jgi:hypothetical protein|nr:hypothetical protein [Hymenobacter sp.]